MAHNRQLVISGVSLTEANLKLFKPWSITSIVRDELEQEIICSGYLDNAPFKWIGLILRYGLKNDVEPHYERINEQHGDLPLAMELDTHILIESSKDELITIFRKATLIALVHAGKKYSLKTDRLEELLVEMEVDA
ncbi:Imm39 family immunity protein [Sphingorhabdus sp. Alg239-R122]|uniref:Imm39 family immunity protein n=1 Tax=Sphingorhabdus sp. Alg239-R122 TaxID=2305989 RepID=UPI0013DBDFD8|nr:Imm39 family immunity protein [Sphingorhabdus sp. Alg239-R122]